MGTVPVCDLLERKVRGLDCRDRELASAGINAAVPHRDYQGAGSAGRQDQQVRGEWAGLAWLWDMGPAHGQIGVAAGRQGHQPHRPVEVEKAARPPTQDRE